MTRAWFSLLVVATMTGCLDRTRLNATCTWADRASAPNGVPTTASRDHLVNDVAIAEELGVRVGDAARGRLPIPERGRLATRCTDSLLTTIAVSHGVTVAQLSALRGVRDPWADFLTVTLPLALLLLIAAPFAANWLCARTMEYPLSVQVALAVLASLGAALAFFAFGGEWAGVAENIRVGNGHLSYRAARIPWNHSAAAIIGLASAVLLVAWLVRRRVPRFRPAPR